MHISKFSSRADQRLGRRHGSLPHWRAARTPRRRLARGAACLDILCGADQLTLPRAFLGALTRLLVCCVSLKEMWVSRRFGKQVHRDILRRARATHGCHHGQADTAAFARRGMPAHQCASRRPRGQRLPQQPVRDLHFPAQCLLLLATANRR